MSDIDILVNKHFFDNLPIPAMVIDDQYKIIYENSYFSDLIGLGPREIEKNCDLMNNSLWSEFTSKTEDLFSKKEEWRTEIDFKFKEKSITAEIFSKRVELSNEKEGFLVILLDKNLEISLYKKYRLQLKQKTNLIQKLKKTYSNLKEQSNYLKLYLFVVLSVIASFSFLAIRFSVETIPPLITVAIRVGFVGVVLALYQFVFLKSRPTIEEVKISLYVALTRKVLYLGGFAWALQSLPSGIGAVIASSIPFWMALLEALKGTVKLSKRNGAGLAFGVLGLTLFAYSSLQSHISLISLVVCLLSVIAYTLGTFSSVNNVKRPLLIITIEMIVASIALVITAAFVGEFAEFRLDSVSTASLIALCFLVFFTGLLGEVGQIWSIIQSTGAKGLSFLLVVPLSALTIGVFLGDETMTLELLLGSILIIGSIFLINSK